MTLYVYDLAGQFRWTGTGRRSGRWTVLYWAR
jgi:hypothetical protein